MSLTNTLVALGKTAFTTAIDPRFIDGLLLLREKETRAAGTRLLIGMTTRALLKRRIAAGFLEAKGFANDLLNSDLWKSAPAHSQPHFGCLEPLAPPTATRADYVALTLEALLALRKAHPHLQLGASAGVSALGREITRLELAQSWAILLNVGHLFGTFATERVVLYHLALTPKDRHLFLGEIDEQLRAPCDALLDSRNVKRFFYVLAAWRVSQIDGPLRAPCIAVLHRYLTSGRPDSDSSHWALRRARQIAYNTIHQLTGITALQPGSDQAIIRSLAPEREIVFSASAGDTSPAARYVDALDEYTQQDVFCSAAASRLVLGHARSLAVWWNEHANLQIGDKVARLFSKPPDLRTVDLQELSSFVRFKLPLDERDWVDVVRRLRVEASTWDDWHFLVTPSARDELTIDIFWTDRFSAIAHYRICEMLAETAVTSWEWTDADRQRACWRAVAQFATRSLGCIFKDAFLVLLKPENATAGAGYAIVASSDLATKRLESFIERCVDMKRKKELSALRHAILHVHDVQSTDLCIIMLAQTRILDRETNREQGELDGVAAFVSPTAVRWILVEEKSGTRSSGRAQLERIRDFLRFPTNAPIPVQLAAGRAMRLDVTIR